MLQYTEKSSAGTEEVSPAAYLSSRKCFPGRQARPCLPRRQLAHAPEVEDGMFRVPSVIE